MFSLKVGGGDIGLMSHDDKIERYENGKWWSFGKMPVRAYGTSAKLPSEWIQGFYIIAYPRGLYCQEQGKLTLWGPILITHWSPPPHPLPLALYIESRECIRNLDMRVQVHPGDIWVSKQGVHISSTRSLKISRCKGWCPKDLWVRAPAAPALTHSLES